MTTVARVLGVARSHLITRVQSPSAAAQASACAALRETEPPSAGGVKVAEGVVGGDLTPPSTAADEELLQEVRSVITERATYGYRRTAAIIRRRRRSEGRPPANHKRVYRVMREHGLLLRRHYGDQPGRVHDGKIITLKSDLRWCTDCFEVRTWNGDRVQMSFVLDCCDREVISFTATAGFIDGQMIRDLMLAAVERRFGDVRTVPHAIEWLSDNGSVYTASDTVEQAKALGFVVCTTPPYSPESNGMAESFVKSFKRDYVYLADVRTAAELLAQLPAWFEDYNRARPHKGLKMLSPMEYREINQAS
ncbi:MAG TPA: IS3 family transposase [Polyangia bacterium]